MNHYRNGSRRWHIANILLANGMDRRDCYAALVDKVNATKPFFWKDRKTGAWLPTGEATRRLDYEIGQVISELSRAGSNPVTPDPDPVTPDPVTPDPDPV